MSTNKNNEYSYDKFLSDSSDDYPKYSDGIEPLTSDNNKPMADFCLQCANEMFGCANAPVKSDFYGLLSKEDENTGHSLPVLCEGCGYIYVDHLGRRQGAVYPEPNKDAKNENSTNKT